jgi:hypothetical protein
MRPYLFLCTMVLIAAAAFGQQSNPRIYGPCSYGCGPFIPLVTTPMVSLQQVSPNPVGASNATTGLVAGATNSTLSQISGNTSSVYTEPVWYQGGGAPLTTSAVHLWAEPLGHPMHAMHEERGAKEETRTAWVYFSGIGPAANATAGVAKGGKKAARTYTNDDVERQNQNNGNVKMKGKSEKL